MTQKEALKMLEKVRDGSLPPETALAQMQLAPYDDLGFAKIDNHRALRQGVSEVIYGGGKTAEQLCAITARMLENGAEDIIITRLSPESAVALSEICTLEYFEIAKLGVVNRSAKKLVGKIVVASGGTSDIPVCEEAALTCEALGNSVTRLYDVGVSGLHRLVSKMDDLASARVIIAVAGMEGALASVIGGLVSCPIIAVATSVGYGASFGGVAALLAMLNSCSAGVGVVNIDNGFGAGFLASRINLMEGVK